MISYLKGKILNKGQGFVILLVDNIGYRVFVNSTMYVELDINQEVEMYIHQHVREDALNLYGFKSLSELEMYELLLTISGIGPKSALACLSIASVADIKESIARGDSSLLVKVSGIGKKTAERVVLELRGKIPSIDPCQGATAGTMANSDEIDALMALGYSMQQAREALQKVDPAIKDSGERIREALKSI